MACSQGQVPGWADIGWAPGTWGDRFLIFLELPGMGTPQLVGKWDENGFPGTVHGRCSKYLALYSLRALPLPPASL